MSNQNELDKILSDFKVPKREVTLDEPEAIKKPVSDEINDAVNFDYLAYTDNIKLDKPINMSNPDVNIDNFVSDALFNHDYRLDPSRKDTPYDKLVKSYQELYKLQQDTEQTLYITTQSYMKLSTLVSQNDIIINADFEKKLQKIMDYPYLNDEQKVQLMAYIHTV